MRGAAMLATMGLCATLAQAASGPGLTLADKGKAGYAIVVADEAPPPEATAAAELQRYLKQSTGADFRVVTESAYPKGRPAILVGRTRRTESRLGGFDWGSLGTDGIVIRRAGRDLILAGGQPRGTLYAVVTFLEEQVGVRWWTATEEDAPSLPVLRVGELKTIHVPKLPMRHNYTMELLGMQPYAGPRVSKEVSRLFCVHLRDTYNDGITEEWGGANTIYSCHTVPLLFLPKERYFDAHPDWFGLVGGQRVFHQVCWMNREMRQELARNVLAFLREHPKVTTVSVSQNDGGNPCECAECRAVVDREGTQMGPILDGVNEVADAVARERPGVMVETLSYYYSRKCPKTMRARDNVLVRVCTYEQTINRPLMESDWNRDNRTNVLEWGGHARNLFVWNYVTDFAHYMYPQPNLFHLAPNLRFFVEHNVKGVFMQGDAFCQTGDFQQLRAWVVSHLLWDPYQDDRKLIRRFCDGYYGKAGQSVFQWIETLHKAGYDHPGFIGIYNGDLSFLTLDVMNRGARLWAEAERAVAEDTVKRDRVRKARLSFDLAWIVRSDGLAREAKAAGKPLLGPTDASRAVDGLFAAMKAFGTTHVSEVGGEMHLFEPRIRGRFTAPSKSELSTEDRVETQESQFGLAEGPKVRFVEDAAASNGKAVMSPGSHEEWVIQWQVPQKYYGRWQCKAYLRVDAGTAEGDGIQLGIYDGTLSYEVLRTTRVPLARCAGKEYREIHMGTHDLKPGMYFWFAPLNRGKDVPAIYADRIVLTRARE